jgi:signal transduction histidine kinase
LKQLLHKLRTKRNQTRFEWGFLTLLAIFCVGLSVLQYRWTGEVSRAEADHLRAGIQEQALQFCRAFDAVLTDSCQALMPRAESLNESNRASFYEAAFQKWESDSPRPLFSRVAVAAVTPGGPQLWNENLANGQLAPMAWPSDWEALHQFLTPKSRMGPRSLENLGGTLFWVPVFWNQPWKNGPPGTNGLAEPDGDTGFHAEGDGPRGRGLARLSEWMIFELDTNYLQAIWLPELTRRYLNPAGQSFNDVEIKTLGGPGKVIFATAGGPADWAASAVKMPLNRDGRELEDHHGPGAEFHWELTVSPHAGALEAMVEKSHRRNLAVAFLLNALIFAAGFALAQHARRSRKLAEEQMNFVATVSHELRTPLTVIRGASHNLLRGVAREPAQIEQYSRLIIQHAEQLTQMVEQILQFAGTRQNATVVSEPLDMAELLHEAVAATSHDTQAAGCVVQLEVPQGLPSLDGDASALRRVFQNLIINAAKHGGAGGWIGITVAGGVNGSATAMEIRVADHGPGIPEAELPEIFKPFFRGAAAQTQQIRGSGLGLSLVKEIVAAHGGTITVENHPGRGAVFVVRLPKKNQ